MAIPELKCMNCGKYLREEERHFFLDVLVCDGCEFIAQRLVDRGTAELKLLLAMLKDAVRLALVHKQLNFKDPSAALSKQNILARIGVLVERLSDRSKWPPNSTETTKQPA